MNKVNYFLLLFTALLNWNSIYKQPTKFSDILSENFGRIVVLLTYFILDLVSGVRSGHRVYSLIYGVTANYRPHHTTPFTQRSSNSIFKNMAVIQHKTPL